mmetsp:Transcript_5244/g.9305  ORF Transcript_5244/g.9305 Transcript_5244/m.9305 type:complete len:1034 (-) Transcript_5244:31-3132(-)
MAEHDLSKIYQTFHGREAARNDLRRQFQMCFKDGSTRYVSISGKSGVGKSRLVQSMEWEKLAQEQEQQQRQEQQVPSDDSNNSDSRCYFVCGKFELSQLTQPFSGMTAALTSLCEQWGSTLEGQKEIADFRRRESRDVYALCTFLPGLYSIFGIVRTLTASSRGRTGSTSTDNLMHLTSDRESFGADTDHSVGTAELAKHSFQRLRTVIYKLIRAVVGSQQQDDPSVSCKKSIVMLLDDIHWADQSSLNLIKFLVQEDLGGPVLFVATFRSEDVNHKNGTQHPVACHMNELRKCSATAERLHTIPVPGFSISELNTIISSFMKKSKQETLPLVKVVHQKTAGNPLTVQRFLYLLEHRGYLSYSSMTCSWEWKDANEIRKAMSIESHEVVEVIASSMRFLGRGTVDVLKIASCLGSQVPLNVLQQYFATEQLTEESKAFALNQVEAILEQQVEKGVFCRPAGSNFFYSWAHDGLQRAAFSLIEDYRREELHFRLGKLLLAMSEHEESEARVEFLVYLATDQLNRATDFLLHEEGEQMKLQLIQLNLQAAKLSISKSAFYRAVDFLETGIALLDKETMWWSQTYHLCLQLHNYLAEMEYTLGNHEKATEVITEILGNAQCQGDEYRARAVLLEVAINGKDRNLVRGVEICLAILKSYSVELPLKPSKLRIATERYRLKKLLPNGRLENLIHMPVMTEPEVVDLAIFLSKLTNLCGLIGDEYVPLGKLAALKTFHLACTYGINSYIALSIAQYAISYRHSGKFDKAFSTASIAAEMLNRFSPQPGDVRAKVLMIIHSALMSLKKPLQDSLEPFLESYRIGIRTGDVDAALTAAMGYGYNYILVGYPLAALADDIKGYALESRQFGLSASLQAQFVIILQTVLNLQGKSDCTTYLKGDAMDQEKFLQNAVEGKGQSMTCRDICIFRLMLACIFRSPKVQIEMLDNLATFPSFNPALARMHLWQVFAGIAAFQLYHRTKENKYSSIGSKSVDYFKEATSHGSLNAYPLLLVLVASKSPSKESFDEAIKVCSRSGFVNF